MLSSRQVVAPDEEAMAVLGDELSQCFAAPGVVYLQGQLGAGKTTLTRAMMRGMGYSGLVKSPTYTLVEPYQLEDKLVFHFDLYRLADPEELEFLGIRDYFHENSICLVEWPDKGAPLLPEPDLTVDIQVLMKGRRIKLLAHTTRGCQWLEAYDAKQQSRE
ncbi:tRNA (adenosine(37)-N6)-threonylcarbamoyltransferase complex ATPase subunit type 1 TsaE [Hahella aquimaris]|uniref:tRNA (adenosine(37)-N6)-threonylcarbamoyltransferase complex ATPase subunit type 1 TsaE n=1 Tax=Hahella sp. HNIBRBA332 TaxID=3015983 RepID=UPI00273C45BE|nr:tRNA (adenosine(37)-N6)-threonylcarbamoyltransferase complex ATPase subunit type 1 TsaE [Hahella sp. HNIBRBA332]WLQ17395.1 tRNA (adenosine(37)-N6)-threonylcarbamoyltransferase complex ATPase subunit type 1 TsaE [Hahella sp. HNIBRBA332]